MPYRICKILEIETGHMLSKHPGACKVPHGHSRRVEIVLEARTLDANDMVCDFQVVKAALGDFFLELDHAMCMNTRDPMYPAFRRAYGRRVIALKNQDPTTEVIARLVYGKVRTALSAYARKRRPDRALRRTVKLVRVRLWETASTWAEYAAE